MGQRVPCLDELSLASSWQYPDSRGLVGAGGVLSDAVDLPGGGPAPLWYYILKEAQVQGGGHHLAQVGGRIVAEVFLGLLERTSLAGDRRRLVGLGSTGHPVGGLVARWRATNSESGSGWWCQRVMATLRALVSAARPKVS
jgi:hypothetical protein